MTALTESTVHALCLRLQKGEVSAPEIARAHRDRLAAVEPRLEAYLTQTPEATGTGTGPLAGIPMAIKDNLVTKGVRTTCGSQILDNWVPVYDATAIAKLNAAGAVLIGKTNMDEFGMGSSTENSSYKVTRNPWALDRVPGGSSGGSAAAVAAGTAAFALGSDTGGSIRQPAAFCGLVGMKPTYGVVSRYGLVAYASSLDQVGPLTRDVRDSALVLQAIAGHDPLDSTSLNAPVPDYVAALDLGVKGLRIGVITELMGEGIDPAVAAAVRTAVAVLESQGARVDVVSLPLSKAALSTYYVVATAEASSNLARFDGVRYGHRAENAQDLTDLYTRTRASFGPEVKRRIMLGTYALAAGYFDAYYKKALQARTLIKRDYDAAFEKFDLLVSPTTPTPAFALGANTHDPLAMYLQDIATIPINLAGLPAMSLPCGLVDGLPIGMQLIGKPLAEPTIYRAAFAYEQATAHHLARPALA